MKFKHIIFFLLCIVSLFTYLPQYNVYQNKEISGKIDSGNNSENDSWFRIWRGDTYSGGENIVLDTREDIIIHGRYGNGNIIVKYNNSGVELWNQHYGNIWNFWEYRIGEDITVDSESNIYLVGHVSGEHDWVGDCFIVKFNETGNIQWEREWGNEEAEYGEEVAVDSEDNIYVAGEISNSSEIHDLFLLKYNQSGDLQWSEQWKGTGWEWITDLEIDEFDNIYVSGMVNNTPNDFDILILKYDKFGILQWNRTWGGDFEEYCFKSAFDSLDRIALLGFTKSFGWNKTIVIKLNSSGNLISNTTINEESYLDFAIDSSDNQYFVRTDEFYANESTDIYVAKYNDTGFFVSDLIWGTNITESLGEIVLDSSDNMYIVGSSGGNMLLVKNPDDKGKCFPPCLFTLSSNTTSLEKNSVLYINWTNSRGADNYSIYMDDNPIKDLNGLILIGEGLKNTSYCISNFSDGKFYCIVAAYNENGYTLSNYIYILVNGNNKISSGLFFLIFTTIGITYVILSIIWKNKLKRYKLSMRDECTRKCWG
ncbi:MAG: hypothetical protein ACFFCI_09745 [Promethearchaeota archaeon]